MELELPTRQKNILEKRGIYTTKDLINLLPRTYLDFSTEFREINYSLSGRSGCFIGDMRELKKKISNNRSVISFKLWVGERKVNVCIVGQNFIYKMLESMQVEPEIAVFGTLEYKEPFGFSIMQPEHISYMGAHKSYLKVEPVYRKFAGLSEEKLIELIDGALGVEAATMEKYDSTLLCKHGFGFLPSTADAYRTLHHPYADGFIRRSPKNQGKQAN